MAATLNVNASENLTILIRDWHSAMNQFILILEGAMNFLLAGLDRGYIFCCATSDNVKVFA
jgi:hypothetical protein